MKTEAPKMKERNSQMKVEAPKMKEGNSQMKAENLGHDGHNCNN